jgi:hypothetical protein
MAKREREREKGRSRKRMGGVQTHFRTIDSGPWCEEGEKERRGEIGFVPCLFPSSLIPNLFF